MISPFNMFVGWNKEAIQDYKNRFRENKGLLEEKLHSPFRSGISGGIQGIMKLAPSDHLPITVNVSGTRIASWNLLAEAHISNFIMNIAEKTYFAKHAQRPDGVKINWYTLLLDFGHYLLKNKVAFADAYQINIDDALLQNFVDMKQSTLAALQLTLARLPKTEKEVIDELDSKIKLSQDELIDAVQFVDHIPGPADDRYIDFQNTVMHLVEIVYAMDNGCLQWHSRLNKLQENKYLLNQLTTHDFICFQECSDPKAILNVLEQTLCASQQNKNLTMLAHHCKAQCNDYCVIFYDQEKYKLEQTSYFGLSFNQKTQCYRKPCIAARFHSLENDERLIIASIHHPGNNTSEINAIISQLQDLDANHDAKVMIAIGDFNHCKHFFDKDLQSTAFQLTMPKQGTMAGFEYGNHNAAIDGALSNTPHVQVEVLDEHVFAEPVCTPIHIQISLARDQPQETPSTSFRP